MCQSHLYCNDNLITLVIKIGNCIDHLITLVINLRNPNDNLIT